MKILLTGNSGQVGWELQRTLAPLGEVVAVDRRAMNLADPDSIRSAIRSIRPDLIVNPAAYTAVDKAETEPELAMAVNGIAPGVMAEEAGRLGAAMIHYSTDYVFDGSMTFPYTEEDAPNPISVYGKTKLAGEQAILAAGIPHLIFRTSWVYGARGKNFLLTILRLAKERDELNIVDDQVGAPTWSRMIAEATALIIARQPVSPVSEGNGWGGDCSGIYHLTAAGSTSWHGFAQAILNNPDAPLDKTGVRAQPRLLAIPTVAYPTPASRPPSSVMSNRKLLTRFGLVLPDWEASLQLCIESFVP